MIEGSYKPAKFKPKEFMFIFGGLSAVKRYDDIKALGFRLLDYGSFPYKVLRVNKNGYAADLELLYLAQISSPAWQSLKSGLKRKLKKRI